MQLNQLLSTIQNRYGWLVYTFKRLNFRATYTFKCFTDVKIGYYIKHKKESLKILVLGVRAKIMIIKEATNLNAVVIKS